MTTESESETYSPWSEIIEASAAAYSKPLPQIDEISKPFWDAAREHRLSIQRCSSCSNYVFFPRSLCPFCWKTELEWVEAKGTGIVYSYTIVRHAVWPGFEADVPYVLAIVELSEGPRLTTNITDVEPESVEIGMPVIVTYDDVTPEVTLVKFRPAVEASSSTA